MKAQGKPVSRKQSHANQWNVWAAVFGAIFVATLAMQFSQPPVLDITPMMYRWNYVLVELGCIVPMLALILRLRRRVG
jgi:hypothetical protein